MTIEQIVDDLSARGVTLEATLVRDEFNGRDGQAVWAVTILRNGQSFQTEFSQGCAYRYYPKSSRLGKWQPHPYHQRMTIYLENRYKQSKPSKPTIDSVMACIVSDAQCVAFGQTFEDFAADMGYDEDSRSAEKCYNACRDEYFALIRLFGSDGFEELCELFQDY